MALAGAATWPEYAIWFNGVGAGSVIVWSLAMMRVFCHARRAAPTEQAPEFAPVRDTRAPSEIDILGSENNMLLEFFASELGMCVLSLALAVGVSLTLGVESTASRVGTIVITAVFMLVAWTQMAHAPGVVPVYVVALSVGHVVADVRRHSDSPLLAGEPYWRKFLLTLVHGRRIRVAAKLAAASRSEKE